MRIESENINDPRASRDQTLERAAQFQSETRSLVDAKTLEIDKLKEKRYELRMSAAATAGNLGLQYLVDSNSFVRLTSITPDEIVVPDPIKAPDPISLESNVANATRAENKKEFRGAGSPKYLVGWDAILWVFTSLIGIFVGIGLATVAGFNWRNDVWFLALGIALGVSVLGGIKIMVSAIWRHVGHQRGLGVSSNWPTVSAILLTTIGCGLDATLGAIALDTYSRQRSINEVASQPMALFFVFALALTMPIIVGSGVVSYLKGFRSVSQEEYENNLKNEEEKRLRNEEMEARLREKQELERRNRALLDKHHADHEAVKEQAAQRHESLKAIEAEKVKEWDELRSHPEFKCLQGLIGQVDVLSREIESSERELTNFRIARGFGKTAVVKNGAFGDGGAAKLNGHSTNQSVNSVETAEVEEEVYAEKYMS